MPRADRCVINPVAPDDALLRRAGALIRAGALVAFPTETVYGLGAHAFDDDAIARVFAAKQRASTDPLIVHLATVADLASVAGPLPAPLACLATHFWPGPLTLVLPRLAAVPARVSAGRETVAVRVPAHPVARGLIRAAGVPVVAPSANRFMCTSATTAAHVLADLGDDIDLILDGGATIIGVESTVVAMDPDGAVRVLRPGAIGVEVLEAHLKGTGYMVEVRVGPPPYEGDGQSGDLAPGLLTTHYAPRARFLLVSGPTATSAVIARLGDAQTTGDRVGLLTYDDDLWPVALVGVERASLGRSDDLDVVAHRLFAALRDLDDRAVTCIIGRTLGAVTEDEPPRPTGTGLARAIDDRLIKAAGSRVIRVG